MANYLELAELWWEECPACENAVPWKGCGDCNGTNKVWPMRRPCPGLVSSYNNKKGEYVLDIRHPKECYCSEREWLPIEDMATLCKELRKAGIDASLDIINGGVIAQVEGHTSTLDDPEEALVNASIEWVKKR